MELYDVEQEFWDGMHHHTLEACDGGICPVHNPTDHHMRKWALHWRYDRGIVERYCTHGVGHPDPDMLQSQEDRGLPVDSIHGCCGCCAPPHEPGG